MNTRIHLRESAFSLIVILAVLVLLSGLLIAFLTKSRMELQATVSYSNSMMANALARGAAEETLAAVGAEAVTSLHATPGSPVLALARVGSNSNDPRVSNLIRRSVGDQGVFEGAYSTAGQTEPVQFASPVATDAASRNGRKIPVDRWEAPQMLSADAPAITAPDWVIVTRGGSKRVADADVPTLRDLEDSGNRGAAVGRYAYMLYDASGLLDANIAGTPASDTDARRAEKGSLASADLIPVFATAGAVPDGFLDWRQGSLDRVYGTDPSPGDPGTSGELELGARATQPASSNRFISRQDMLRFMENFGGGTVFPKELAPWFTTYSLTSNAPEISAALSSANNVAADLSIPRYRVEDAQADPYTIKVGSPLFARKFPLSRLRWFEQRDSAGAPKADVRAAIKQHFGLTWFDNLGTAGIAAPEYQEVGGFVYTSPDEDKPVDSIKTLAQVAALAKREPDFFEWLKEAIHPGSLATTGGLTNSLLPGSTNSPPRNDQELSADFHLIQIGANILDQADSDDAPTLIASAAAPDRNGGPLVAFGVENLPYLNELVVAISRSPSATTEDSTEITGWLQPEIWCPHATAGKIRRDYKGDEMTSFRARMVEGRSLVVPSVFLRAASGTALGKLKNDSMLQCTNHPKTYSGGPDDTLWFTANSGDYLEPKLLGADSINTFYWGRLTNPKRALKPGPAPWEPGFAGISAGSSTAPNEPYTAGSVLPYTLASPATTLEDPNMAGFTYPIGKKCYNFINVSFDPNVGYSISPSASAVPGTIVMEAKINGVWVPYQTWEQILRFTDMNDTPGGLAFNYALPETMAGNAPFPNNLSWCRPNGSDGNPYPTENSLAAGFLYGWNVDSPRSSMQKADPRTRRFGTGTSSCSSPGVSIRDTVADWYGLTDATQAGSGSAYANWDSPNVAVMGIQRSGTSLTALSGPLSGWSFRCMNGNAVYGAPLADLGRNLDNTKSGMRYADPDGVIRPADFAYVSDADFPTIPGQKRARPAILNRPFRSVAELGYVSRDIPWRSLDFVDPPVDDPTKPVDPAKPINPDAKLLNVFCIEDNSLISGKINPYIARQETLEAVFRGAQRNASDAAWGSVSTTDAATVAKGFLDLIESSKAPKLTSGDTLGVLNQVNSVKPSGAGPKFKTEAEAYGRALAGVTNRRTWTLLLDVIAQAGCYPISAAKLEDFIVSAERRYWVHVTLDRYTGKVLHMEYEPVYE